jgi:thiol-disulfide isomerase/thioredoxin
MTKVPDGRWQGVLTFDTNWLAFGLFYIRDDRDRVDNNTGQYWEVITCGSDRLPSARAASYQAASYTGDALADGIQRAPDFERAIAILRQWMVEHRDSTSFVIDIWSYRLRQAGRSDAAFSNLLPQIEQFVADNASNEIALAQALQFISTWRARLPAASFETTRAALVELTPKSAFAKSVLARQAWERIADEKDARGRIQMYEDFVAAYPGDANIQPAYARAFMAAANELKDVAAADRAFEKWRAFEPASPDPYASMGRLYVERQVEPGEALRLLGRAIDLCQAGPAGSTQVGGIRQIVTVICDEPDPKNPAPGQARLEQASAKIRYWRGQAFAQQDEMARALEDLQFAARILNDDAKVALTLGQVAEKAGRTDVAFAAYLEAATSPYQTSRGPADALRRVFVTGAMGSDEELDARIAARIEVRRKKAAAVFKPVPVDRPAPAFEATLLDGRQVSLDSLRGHPAVLNFWATWCGPCVAELPGVLELQRRNPQVAVIALAKEDEPADVRSVLDKRNLKDLRVGISDAAARAFAVDAVPATYVIDGKGHIRFVHLGSLDDFVAMIEKELAMLSGT